jgi:hypothetical protein
MKDEEKISRHKNGIDQKLDEKGPQGFGGFRFHSKNGPALITVRRWSRGWPRPICLRADFLCARVVSSYVPFRFWREKYG